jgi:hypothetical protein
MIIPPKWEKGEDGFRGAGIGKAKVRKHKIKPTTVFLMKKFWLFFLV